MFHLAFYNEEGERVKEIAWSATVLGGVVHTCRPAIHLGLGDEPRRHLGELSLFGPRHRIVERRIGVARCRVTNTLNSFDFKVDEGDPRRARVNNPLTRGG